MVLQGLPQEAGDQEVKGGWRSLAHPHILRPPPPFVVGCRRLRPTCSCYLLLPRSCLSFLIDLTDKRLAYARRHLAPTPTVHADMQPCPAACLIASFRCSSLLSAATTTAGWSPPALQFASRHSVVRSSQDDGGGSIGRGNGTCSPSAQVPPPFKRSSAPLGPC